MMEHTLAEWVTLSGAGTMAQAAIAEQARESEQDAQSLRARMASRLQVMREAVQAGLDPALRSTSGMTGGRAALLRSRARKSWGGDFLGLAQAYALATAELNAAMGRIVAAPTAGACGILPGCLLAAEQVRGLPEDALIDALFVAAAVGSSVAQQASLSGAECGCQAECGTAAAMAAAALVSLEGGSAQQCCDAAAFAIMNLLGLVCDPVGGLVEVPCVYRNVGACGVAATAADLALSGVRCPIVPDEVILALKEVGEAMPASLRETAEGGCAACASARCLCKK